MAHSTGIYCTLTPEEFRDRRAQARATLVPHVLSTTLLTDGLRVDFGSAEELRDQVKEFIGLEQECCSFMRFTLSEPVEGLHVLIQGPPEAAMFIDEIFRQTIQGTLLPME